MTQEVLRGRTTEEWIERLEAEDVPCAPVLTRHQMIRHPQVAANALIVETEHPRAGWLRQARTPAVFFRHAGGASARRAGPRRLDSSEILLAEAGYSAEEIAALLAMGRGDRGGTMITFFYAPTPNGWKVAIMLECGLAYKTRLLRLGQGDQFAPEFPSINPNAKIPAIVDDDPPAAYGADAGQRARVGRGSCSYLAGKAGSLRADRPAQPQGADGVAALWQVGNQGLMKASSAISNNYAPEGGVRAEALTRASMGAISPCWRTGSKAATTFSASTPSPTCWPFPGRSSPSPWASCLIAFPCVAAWRGRIKERPAVRRAIDLHKDRQNRGELDCREQQPALQPDRRAPQKRPDNERTLHPLYGGGGAG